MKNLEQFTLLRSLFPSWRFFTEVVEVPILQYRLLDSQGECGAWKAATQKLPVQWGNVFFNPEGNIAMAVNSLLEYFQAEIESNTADLPCSVSYALVSELVRATIRTHESVPVDARFQFRIGLIYQGSPLEELREILVSESMQVAT